MLIFEALIFEANSIGRNKVKAPQSAQQSVTLWRCNGFYSNLRPFDTRLDEQCLPVPVVMTEALGTAESSLSKCISGRWKCQTICHGDVLGRRTLARACEDGYSFDCVLMGCLLVLVLSVWEGCMNPTYDGPRVMQ
jgi:hypothetical protein